MDDYGIDIDDFMTGGYIGILLYFMFIGVTQFVTIWLLQIVFLAFLCLILLIPAFVIVDFAVQLLEIFIDDIKT